MVLHFREKQRESGHLFVDNKTMKIENLPAYEYFQNGKAAMQLFRILSILNGISFCHEFWQVTQAKYQI